jgi:hypothetical protein
MTAWTATKDQLPDDEMTVLLALADGEVWPGFHEDDKWFYVSADPVGVEVLYWTEFAAHPDSGDAATCMGLPTTDEVHKGDLRRVLRDLIATIELQTDCMDNTIDRATLDPYIERAEDLLGETVEEILA